MYGKVESFVAGCRPQRLSAGVKFGIVLIALAALCTSAAAQENTAQDWYQKGQDLARNGSLLDAVNAYDKAIDLNPGNLDARLNKAMALHQAGKANESVAAQNEAVKGAISFLGDLNQSVQVFNNVIEPATSSSPAELAEAWDQRGFLLADLAGPLGDNVSMYEEAIAYFDRAIELDPQRKSAWINKGAVLGTRLNRYDEALLAYEKAIELGGADAEDNETLSNAWNGKGAALAKLGRLNESMDAFDKAIELSPQTAAFVWLSKGDVFNESGRYDEAVEAYDKVVELNSSMKALIAHAYDSKGDALSAWGRYDEAVKAYDNAIEQYSVEPMGAQTWYKKGLALEALGRKNEANVAFSKAEELGYEMPFASSLVLTDIVSVGDDEFIEMTNDGADAQTFEDLTLTIDDKGSVVLPDFILEPGERIRFHLGSGERNETDIFLNSGLALDDVSGNLTLKDSAGTLDKFTAYWTPEANPEYWIEKGRQLQSVESYEDALDALNNATDVDPQNAMAWLSKAQILGPSSGRYNESLEACEKAIEIDPENPESWRLKGLILMNLGRDEEALVAFDEAIELDPQNGFAWHLKGNLLQRLGREDEADAALARAEELGFTSPLEGMIAITEIAADGEDEFVEISNNLDEAKNLRGWTLVVDGDEAISLVLPEYILEPGEKVRVHFGAGEDGEADLFMESEIALNDAATNVTLRDEGGREISFLGFERLPDGGVVMRMRDGGEFGY